MSKTAFDAVANQYDQEFTHTDVGLLQRKLVYQQVEKVLANYQVSRVLELNCGTGEDALWLAQKGLQVHATDISSKMVAVAQKKGARSKIDSGVLTYQTLDCNQLSALGDRKFDLIFSNFGGLNCLSPEELQGFSEECTKYLAPGGIVIAVVMSSFCWWETLYFLLKRNWKQAWRRRSKTAIQAPLDGQTSIATWYYSPAVFSRFFSKSYTPRLSAPVGFWLPPSYLDPFFRKRPKTLKILNHLEQQVQQLSFLSASADHYIQVLQCHVD